MKQVLITGGATGIGAATAQVFLERGYRVFVTVHQTAAELPGVTAIPCDITDPADVERLFAAVGTVDVLVNNAGITKDNLIMKMSEEEFDKVIEVNLKGAFNCMKHVSRIMLKQRSGHIINMSSVSGVMGNAGQVNYCASKAGIIGMTKSLARELGSRGITVNAIAPGFIETEMTDVLPEDVKENLLTSIPLKRMGQTKDIAETVAFLASDKAAYITGQTISVDGGMGM